MSALVNRSASVQVQALVLDGQVQAGIRVLTIDNPAKRNAMNLAMWEQLHQAFVQLQVDAQVRVVIVRGAPGAFCAGGDISQYPAFRFTREGLAHFHDTVVWGALQAMLDCDVPMLACIDGACMGAGLEMASCCDIRMASHASMFGAPIAKLGFPMAPQELALVSREVGVSMARHMLLEAAAVPAQRLHQQGFLSDCLPADQLWPQVVLRAQRMAQLSPLAARGHKKAIRAMQQGVALSDPYAYAADAEHREGIAAFLEKRVPTFATAQPMAAAGA